jgi:hypothetical protein
MSQQARVPEIVSKIEAQMPAIQRRQAEEHAEMKPFFEYLGTDRYDEDALKAEVKVFVTSARESAIEAGIRLSILKANMGFPAFVKFIEESALCEVRHALYLIQVAGTVALICRASGGKIDLKQFRKIDTKKILAIGFIGQSDPESLKKGKIGDKEFNEAVVMTRAELLGVVAELKKKATIGGDQIHKLRKTVEDKDAQIRAYQTHDESFVQRACSTYKKRFLDATHEFLATIKQLNPKGEFAPEDLLLLFDAREFVIRVPTIVFNWLEQNYPDLAVDVKCFDLRHLAEYYDKLEKETRLPTIFDEPVEETVALASASVVQVAAVPANNGNGKKPR